MNGRPIFVTIVCQFLGIFGVVTSLCFQWKDAIPGRKTGHVIHSYQSMGITSCSKECLIRKSCAFINFDPGNLLCELIGKNSKDNSLLGGHFKHIDKFAMDRKVPTGVCNDKLCAIGQRCTVTKHSYACVQTECPQFNYGGVTLQDSSTLKIGSEIKMVCENKRNISIVITLRCLPNGSNIKRKRTVEQIDQKTRFNGYFHSYVDTIYPGELEIKDTTESDTSVSYLDILLEKDVNGNRTTKPYGKRDDFNFPYFCSKIPLSPAYGVYISQLIRYARACSAYEQFLKRECIQAEGFQMSNDTMSQSCYKPVDQVQSCSKADEYCKNFTSEGHLAFPLTRSSTEIACRLINSSPGKEKILWIGGKWVDTHTIVTTSSLGNISASSVAGLGTFLGAGCLALNCTDFTMAVQNCNIPLPFVCEKEIMEIN